MASTNIRPKWWQLYLTFPLLVAVFLVDNRLRLSTRGHQAVQIAILVLVFGLVHLWLKANARALSRMDQQRSYGTVRVIRIPLVQDSEFEDQKGSMLHLPESEIKGLLTDTADIHYMGEESTSIQEIHKN